MRQEIAGGYVLLSETPDSGPQTPDSGLQPPQVGFAVAAYDSHKPLVIDPGFSYSTYLGGSDVDRGNSIAVDTAGNAYVTGSTTSPDFPTAHPVQLAAGGGDAFVAKIGPNSNCGNGILDPREECDDGNLRNGDCCSATCQFEAAGTVCRAAAGACDAVETCTGTSALCPANGFKAAGTHCRAPVGACEVAASCTGTSAYCPANGLKAAGTVCRPAVGACDVTETCSGTSTSCPANTYKASTTVCRPAAGACDVAASCTRTSAYCPVNGLRPDSTTCDDGDPATCNDQCTAGSCAGTAC